MISFGIALIGSQFMETTSLKECSMNEAVIQACLRQRSSVFHFPSFGPVKNQRCQEIERKNHCQNMPE